MDRHTCKLCFRRFQNGRALGGHMRSHVMAAAAAAAAAVASAAYSLPPPQQQQSPPLSFASTSSTDIDGKPSPQKPLSCFWREDSKKSGKVGAPEFSGGCFGGVAAAGESSVVQDGESDTESPRGGGGFAVSRRRSKRARRRAPPSAPDPEPASSISDATQEEDVAMSLVMLSRDSWTRSRSEPEHPWARASSEAEQNNDNVNVFDEDEDVGDVAGEDYEAWYGEPPAAHPRTRHRCGVCKKLFRSYQALGGHRARVKKGKGGCVPPPLPAPAKASYRGGASVIHECPFCFRVFGSGQALGGHKRAHMPSGGALAPPPPLPSPVKCGDSFGSFDLNVPAALDDDFELSAVYDAEYGSSRH